MRITLNFGLCLSAQQFPGTSFEYKHQDIFENKYRETSSDNQGGDKVDRVQNLKLDRKLTIDLEVQPSPRPDYHCTRDREYKRVKDMAIVLNYRHMNMRSERRIYLVPLRTSEPS